MEVFSPYVLAIILGWVVAQGLKYIILAVKDKSLMGFRHLYASGSMPSAHTATVIAMMTVIGLKDGVQSGLFALALLFATIVMYDAVMVRRSAGEQGQAIQGLILELSSKLPLPRAALGHTPLEVLVGAVLGLIIGLVVFFATR